MYIFRTQFYYKTKQCFLSEHKSSHFDLHFKKLARRASTIQLSRTSTRQWKSSNPSSPCNFENYDLLRPRQYASFRLQQFVVRKDANSEPSCESCHLAGSNFPSDSKLKLPTKNFEPRSSPFRETALFPNVITITCAISKSTTSEPDENSVLARPARRPSPRPGKTATPFAATTTRALARSLEYAKYKNMNNAEISRPQSIPVTPISRLHALINITYTALSNFTYPIHISITIRHTREMPFRIQASASRKKIRDSRACRTCTYTSDARTSSSSSSSSRVALKILGWLLPPAEKVTKDPAALLALVSTHTADIEGCLGSGTGPGAHRRFN